MLLFLVPVKEIISLSVILSLSHSYYMLSASIKLLETIKRYLSTQIEFIRFHQVALFQTAPR